MINKIKNYNNYHKKYKTKVIDFKITNKERTNGLGKHYFKAKNEF
jgi:hypothetical protein